MRKPKTMSPHLAAFFAGGNTKMTKDDLRKALSEAVNKANDEVGMCMILHGDLDEGAVSADDAECLLRHLADALGVTE